MSGLRYLSVCAGIEAASVAWQPLGWELAAYSEIDAFPCAVLAHHYPQAPNLGDMTKHEEWDVERIGPVDVLVGGTPCQSFSVAGLRRGLEDERGNLALTFINIADQFSPEWVVWENVPGVLSDKGNAFGCFLAGLVGADEPIVPDGRWPRAGVVTGPKRTAAWRILDAQFFGVAQRRRRVFVLAVRGSGNWASAAALFPVGESLLGNSAPRRGEGEGVANALTERADRGGTNSEGQRLITVPDGSPSLNLGGMAKTETFVPVTVGALMTHHTPNGHGVTGGNNQQVAAGHVIPVAHAIHENQRAEVTLNDTDGALKTSGGKPGQGYLAALVPAVAWTASEQANSYAWERPYAPTITAQQPSDTSNVQTGVRIGMQVRRLTPVECCRLQGFPDAYLDITYRGKPAADGVKYKALGNSMAVPVVRWLGRRIAQSRRLMEAA